MKLRMRISSIPILLLPAICGCLAAAPPPVPRLVSPAERAGIPAGEAAQPLVVEVALLPEPGTQKDTLAPMTRAAYLDEIRECREHGASVVRLQPLAEDSSPGDYRFDRSPGNYRSLVCEVLRECPDIIIDLDLEGAGGEVEEWVRHNRRIELDSGREEANPVTVAVGDAPLEMMRRVIAEGGHLRLGLSDSRAWPYKGRPTNLDYLRQAVSMAREARRPLATPKEARRIMGMEPLRKVYVVPGAAVVKPGEEFTLDAIVGPLDQPFRAYAVIVNPSGEKYSLRKGAKPVRGVQPFRGGRGIKGTRCERLIRTVIKPGTPPGTYRAYLGLFPRRAPARPQAAIDMAAIDITVMPR